MVAVPAATIVTVFPETVAVLLSSLVKVTGSPELADAVTRLWHSRLGLRRLAMIGRVLSAPVCAAAAVLGT